MAGRKWVPFEERFWEKARFDAPNVCWEWTAAKDTCGYGVFSIEGGRHSRASRVAYELTHGPIPEGWDIHHLCRNPACVNPRHLEAVPHRTNLYHRRFRARQIALAIIEDEFPDQPARTLPIAGHLCGWLDREATKRHLTIERLVHLAIEAIILDAKEPSRRK